MVAAVEPSPTILDTDYGSFIDDIFAVGLLLQSTDVLDPRLILTTSEEPEWSANCVSEQLYRSDLVGIDVPVAIGETLPPYSERGSVCGVPGLVGFALHDVCAQLGDHLSPPIPNGVDYAATMIRESDRNDWTYIAIGGQTSLQKLVRNHPEVLSKIRDLVIMGGNWCTGFDAYPGVPAPTDETNIGCDMAAANYVLEVAAEANLRQQYFPAIHYVPVETVDVIDGDDYLLIKDAAEPSSPHYHKAAEATIGFYDAWSAAARASPELLVYKEAMTFDPATESTPQFDAVAVLVAMDIARGVSGARVAQHEFANGVHFVTNREAALAKDHPDFFRGKSPPAAAYTLWTGDEASLNDKIRNQQPISGLRCDSITPHEFDPNIAPPSTASERTNQTLLLLPPPVAIRAALGFVSKDTHGDFFHEMALRISGRYSPPPPPPSVLACNPPATTSFPKTEVDGVSGNYDYDSDYDSDSDSIPIGLDSRDIEQNISTTTTIIRTTTTTAATTTTTSTIDSSRSMVAITEECLLWT